ncbi:MULTISPECIES: plasmid replication protein, CyRepA1 family [unclassified Microcoleus]|uniref:plasmid replication protein, CyRepA1 family n=1 Tax=unclassified Microcoleus TaxID=2642155 RepID=UPI002FD097B5
MDTIVHYTEPFSQNHLSASLDKFDKDYIEKLVYKHLVEESGIGPDLLPLNCPSASGLPVYDLLYRDTDKILKSGDVSAQARKNYGKCEGAIGFIVNGRFRQLDGPPIAFNRKKENKGFGKTTEKLEPRKYHQPYGKPLEVFFARVTLRIWKKVAAKANLPMPEFPVIGVDGEAIGFWEWVKATKCPIVITEGEKKALALISRGYAAIGLPGINTGYRVTERGETVTNPDGTEYQRAIARELHAALQSFDTAGRVITIIFDYRAGDYRQSKEFRAATTTARLLKSAIAKIALLPGPDKGVDDFCVAGGDIDAMLADAKDYRKLAIENQWRRARRYTPTHTINSRYFHAPAPAAGTVTGINSGLATGKTQFIKDIIASNPEGKIIVLGSRNGLLLQTAEKCGFYHLNAHNGYLMFRDPNARLCLCFDSLLKLPSEIFEGATIILDEAESVLRHLLMSPTLKRDREAIKARFTEACGDADRIILLDGHLTDFSVNLVEKLAGNKTVTKHLNEFKGNCPKVSVYETEKATPTAAEKQDFINKILASDCPAIATDCSVAEAEALADTLTEAKGPGLLICSKNSNEPDQTEFQTNPDAWMEKDNPAWLIYSPTLENGIDISKCGKFTDVFGLFCGLLGVNSLIQMLRRVRHPLNQISVLCPKRGLSDNPDRRSYYASQIKLQIEASINIESALLCPADYQEAIREEINRQFADPLFAAYCHFEAQENLEKSELRAFLIEALRDGGYEVDEPIIGNDKSGDHADKKAACKEKEAQEIFDSPDISLEEAQEISRSNKARWPERCQAEKCYLKARLPGIEDTKLWGWELVHRIRSKDKALLSQLENSWLFHNPDDAEYLQKSKWESGKFESFLPDHSPQWLKLKALHKLQISQFLNPDACWNSESPEIKKLLEDGDRKDARKILGEPGEDGIKYLKRLLGLIGIELVHRQVRGEDGKRIHVYRYQPQPTIRSSRKGPLRICSLPEDWPELAELTAARMSQKIEAKKAAVKSAESFTPSALDAVTDSSDFININLESSVTEITPENTAAGSAAGAISQVAIEAEAEAEHLIARWTGWVNCWGKWVEARVAGWCEYGTRYVVQYLQASGDIGEMLVFPENFVQQAEGGAPC